MTKNSSMNASRFLDGNPARGTVWFRVGEEHSRDRAGMAEEDVLTVYLEPRKGGPTILSLQG